MVQARVVRSSEGDVYDPLWVFKTGSRNGARFDFAVGTVPYLSGPPLHVHDEQDDSFFVLEGVLTVQVGEDLHDLRPGDFASVPPGLPHTFDNVHAGQDGVRVCNMMTPGGLDDLFHSRLTEGDGSEETGERIRREHGITVVGPTLGARLGLV